MPMPETIAERRAPTRFTWAVIWACGFVLGLVLLRRLWTHQLVDLESEGWAYLAIGCLLFVSLPASVGSLFGRWWVGALVGFGLFVAYVAIAVSTFQP